MNIKSSQDLVNEAEQIIETIDPYKVKLMTNNTKLNVYRTVPNAGDYDNTLCDGVVAATGFYGDQYDLTSEITYEYGARGLPIHAPELVKTCGSHGACCTCVAEAGHKQYIKQAANFSRTYASRNVSQDSMLGWVQRQTLWSAVIKHQTQDPLKP